MANKNPHPFGFTNIATLDTAAIVETATVLVLKLVQLPPQPFVRLHKYKDTPANNLNAYPQTFDRYHQPNSKQLTLDEIGSSKWCERRD